MNILFPIAGKGERFKAKNIMVPKPLVEVEGKTLLEHSINTLKIEGKYIFVVLKYDDSAINKRIEDIISKLKFDSSIIVLDTPTRGMAETCLSASHLINTDEELLITNVDQYLNWSPSDFLNYVRMYNLDACVSTYNHADIQLGTPSKYAFVRLDDNGNALEFREKFAISEHAMNGIYYWKHGVDFINSAKAMIADNITVNGEFYVSPSYNYMINDEKIIKTYKMNQNEFYSFGSPEEISISLQTLTL